MRATDAVQHVAGVALDQAPVGPGERAHHERGVGLVAQDAEAREIGHGEEVGIADRLAEIGAGHHVAGHVEGHDGGTEGDAVVHHALEVRDAHRLATGDGAIVAILDADALNPVGAEPPDDLVARARKPHRAACRLAHSSTLPLVGSRGRTIAAEAGVLKAAGVWGLSVERGDARALALRFRRSGSPHSGDPPPPCRGVDGQEVRGAFLNYPAILSRCSRYHLTGLSLSPISE